jgi:phage shock protein C
MSEQQLTPEQEQEQAAPVPEVTPVPPVPEATPVPPVPEVTPAAPRRLMRSRRDRVIAGVCGGLGQYFGVDPVLIRALWVFLALITWGIGGVFFYLLALLVMPENTGEEQLPVHRLPIQGNVFWGGLLVLAGFYFLASAIGGQFIPSWIWGVMQTASISLVLIAAGLLVIFSISRRESTRRLTRSRKERMIAGVCGGLGQYFKIDATWVRLIWILLTLVSVGVGAILYVVAMLAIPEE